MSARRGALGVASVLFLVGLLAVPGAALLQAPAVQTLATQLPSARDGAAAVWTGQYAYLFGGWAGDRFVDEILRFDPATGVVATMGAHLPRGLDWASAVWTGSEAYIFGGVSGWNVDDHRAEILRFDPATDTVATMSATLPFGRAYTAAVWDGRAAYIFGGSYGPLEYTDQVLRFDPAAQTVAAMKALPLPEDSISAVWDGEHAWLFGGSASLGAVRRFTPATNEMATMKAVIPFTRTGTSAVWTGSVAYVFGGWYLGLSRDDVWQYDPAKDAVILLQSKLPTPRANTAAAWDGAHAYVFGGRRYDVVDSFLRDVVRYDPGFEVAVQNLQPGTWVRGTIEGLGGSSDEAGLTAMRFQLGDAGVRTDAWPHPASFDTTALPDGANTMRLTGSDANGGTSEHDVVVNVDNTPPNVAITSPSGVQVSNPPLGVFVSVPGVATVAAGLVQVKVQAADPQPGSGVALVRFSVDGELRATDHDAPYEWPWATGDESLGSHTLTVTAVDAVGNAASTSLRVDVVVPVGPHGLLPTLDGLPL